MPPFFVPAIFTSPLSPNYFAILGTQTALAVLLKSLALTPNLLAKRSSAVR
jgi:hypothetical protein